MAAGVSKSTDTQGVVSGPQNSRAMVQKAIDVARQSASPGQSGLAAPAESAPLRGAIVSVSADLKVRVNGADTAPDDIAATLDALYDRGARTAIVVADTRATVQDLVSALERARQSKIAVAIAQ